MNEERKPQTDGKKSSKKATDHSSLKEEVIAWLSSGRFLTEYCRLDATPSRTTIYNWMDEDKQFAERVAHARARGEEVLFEQNLGIVDEAPPIDANGRIDPGYVSWQKNRVWARMEMLKRLNPRKYGDKVGLQHEGGVSLSIITGIPDGES